MPSDPVDPSRKPRRADLFALHTLSVPGLVLGVLFFAASLTPSLVPRPPLIQGVLGGLSLSVGYAIGVTMLAVWHWLGLPEPRQSRRRLAVSVAIAAGIIVLVLALAWSSGWQNRLRAVMGIEPIDGIGWITIIASGLLVFAVLLFVSRLFVLATRRLSRRLATRLSQRLAQLIATTAVAVLFWSVLDGVLIQGMMRMADRSLRALDMTFEASVARPSDPLKSGAPGSLLSWEGLGRAGREMIAGGPTRDDIARISGRAAQEPLRVYVGLNSAESPQERAQLALAELIRIGAFERRALIIATPTGTGWIDPESQSALEYVLSGDVATVAVQYSYLSSWIALLVEPEYGLETARAVFAEIYGHWTTLPRDSRPRLYLFGLSLGAYNSDLSHDLFQVIGDPYDGALWTGPPFNTRTWREVTRMRVPGSPVWLPMFRDGSVVRFLGQNGTQFAQPAEWGPYRIVFLQHASDAVSFYEPTALWRKPAWLAPPTGPDVSPDFVWLPIVTFLQITFDVMFAVVPPAGHGHVYAFPDYVHAWSDLTGAPGWTPEGLERLRQIER